jgi:hypothetical protein
VGEVVDGLGVAIDKNVDFHGNSGSAVDFGCTRGSSKLAACHFESWVADRRKFHFVSGLETSAAVAWLRNGEGEGVDDVEFEA